MQVGVVVFAPIANIFKLVVLNKTQWIYVVAISIMPLIIMEMQKKFNEIKFGKVVYSKQKKIEVK